VGSRVEQLEIREDARVFHATMPAGRNRWFIVAAAVFGVPWLLGYVVLCVIIVSRAGGAGRGALLVFMLTLLTILIDVVAGASIWAALYALAGRESILADVSTVTVRRSAAGLTVPFRAKRGLLDRVEPVTALSPARKVPYPRLELRGARSRLRFGAGLTAEEAVVLELALTGFLDRTRGQHPESSAAG